MLVAGDGDGRFPPWHARKMAASLQAMTAASAPVLLLHDEQAGPLRGPSADASIDALATELRFLIWQTQ